MRRKNPVLILISILLFTALNIAFSQQFTEMTEISLQGVVGSSIAWSDCDNDSDLDILLTGATITGYFSKIYRNNGNSTFSEQSGISLKGGYNGSVDWGDYDNDGDLDILITGYVDGDYVSKIYRNDGNETFNEQTEIGLPVVYKGSGAWGDYDCDGDFDILLTGNTKTGTDITKIYENNGYNSFTVREGISLTGVKNGSVAWGDYDNDGDLDILITGAGGTSGRFSKIYRNNGDKTFSEQYEINLDRVLNSSSTWGDYDNDGDLDILLSGASDEGLTYISKIYRNNGDNTFSEQNNISLTGIIGGSVEWGDYDNDGDLDILLTGHSNSGRVSKIYRNNGDNTFSEQIEINLTAIGWSSGVWGDYDNDGDLDILLSGSSSDDFYVSKIYRNNNTNSNLKPSSPSELTASLVSNSNIALHWNKSYDNETPQNGLTYNLRVGITPGGCEIKSPMADISTGYRELFNSEM